jgi:hypothetical protein
MHSLTLTYVPLLQLPPLHPAIMVAHDSPLTIDCVPLKAVGYSSTHSDLDPAVANLRMPAYMWQAMTAGTLRVQGVGRRTFHLDQRSASDTVSRKFLDAGYSNSIDVEGAMR